MSSIIEAASLLLARSAGSHEVYLVARSPQLRFMGGMIAFPGGKVHSSDQDLAVHEHGISSRHVAVVRETFEETGILLARDDWGRFPVISEELSQGRQALLDEKITFADFLHRAGLHIHAEDFRSAGHLVTPPFSAVRFDTAFYVAILPVGQAAEVWTGELTAGWWESTSSALERWRQGELLLSPPTYSILASLKDRPVEELPIQFAPLLAQLDAGLIPPIWFSPGVLMIPLHCQGLPPTTHTNAFLIGTGPRYLIDPGPVDPLEQQKLFTALGDTPVDGIILSHHHPDHVGAVQACVERYRVPVLAHPITADRLRGQIEVNRFIHDGDRIDLGTAPHGKGSWSLEAILTPGHAPGHLTFYEPQYRLLFVGDMLSPLSSMIITPDDGDLALYLDSLRRLAELPMRLLLPSHGGATARGKALIEETITHRLQREKQLLETMADRDWSLGELTEKLYSGFPDGVQRLARVQLHAGLIKLQREGRVEHLAEDRWRRAE